MENYDIKWWLNGVSVIYPDIHPQFLKDIDLENNNVLDFYYNNICLDSIGIISVNLRVDVLNL